MKFHVKIRPWWCNQYVRIKGKEDLFLQDAASVASYPAVLLYASSSDGEGSKANRAGKMRLADYSLGPCVTKARHGDDLGFRNGNVPWSLSVQRRAGYMLRNGKKPQKRIRKTSGILDDTMYCSYRSLYYVVNLSTATIWSKHTAHPSHSRCRKEEKCLVRSHGQKSIFRTLESKSHKA
ncbi:hypothetical protein BDP81DRAFT_430396 [Colletotrichum phormii]|uniref:Uncharacterized protein n=1 Tax=Colletotrichum phormii TaxID=359342 RepID=A0AAI9ZS61_9PEZI|nr:uncharacterized protein BDP81DRAFT_430396 [Colletotrichum phormii]KAK1635849.1 hypothetical protein BDP81DRAFT_430396 [Colletotrichum phormii]